MGQFILPIFKSQEKSDQSEHVQRIILTNQSTSKNHSDQSEHVQRISKLYFCLFQKDEIFFPHFFFQWTLAKEPVYWNFTLRDTATRLDIPDVGRNNIL